MTKLEHAIKHIKTRADAWAVKEVTEALQSISERLDKALSQEPCDDAISRDAVLNAICDYVALEEYEDKSHTFTIRPLEKRIDELPSVTQKSKEGHWISYYDEDAKGFWFECDRCHAERAFNTDYCPDCGCRMVATQEGGG